MEKKDTSRRAFLATALLAGVAAGCSPKKNPFEDYAGNDVKASGETVKLL